MSTGPFRVAPYQHQQSAPRPGSMRTRTSSCCRPAIPARGGVVGGGQRLDSRMRAVAEARFGHDFSRVRIHTGQDAAASAAALHARAYTVGHDIVFAAGEYQPQTAAGRWLIAHELAHVVQQGAGAASGSRGPVHAGPLTAPSPHPRPLSQCAGRGVCWRQTSWQEESRLATTLPSPTAVGEGLGVRAKRGNHASPSAHTSDYHAAEREARTAASAAVMGEAPVAVTRRVAGPVVQKQDAGVDEPAPKQAPSTRWSPRDLSIAVFSSRARTHDGGWGSACAGFATPGRHEAFSACGRVEEFCSTPAVYPFRIWFHVDSVGMPRPQPFRPPAVEMIWQFTGAGGASQSGHEKDPAPTYVGDGHPLAPSFGQMLRVTAPTSGHLSLTLALTDPDSGAGVTYRDRIECRLVPCA